MINKLEQFPEGYYTVTIDSIETGNYPDIQKSEFTLSCQTKWYDIVEQFIMKLNSMGYNITTDRLKEFVEDLENREIV